MTIRCAIYIRISDQEKAGEKNLLSLESQEMYIRDFISRNDGWLAVNKVYCDNGFTGKNTKRFGLQDLLDDVASGFIDQIVVYRLDRLTRSLFDYVICKNNWEKLGVKLVAATENLDTTTPEGKLLVHQKMIFAEYERETISVRTKNKIASCRKSGLWTGGNPPLGYTNVNKRLVINNKTAPLIRFMYERFIETRSPTQVANELNLKRLTLASTKRVPIFKCKLISVFLKRPCYKGYVLHEGEQYKGQHEPIVSEEMWNKAQDLLNMPSIKAPGEPNNIEYALRGRLRCKECDRAMVIGLTNKKHKKYAYCTCLNKHSGLVCKGLDMNVNVDLVHRIVIKEMRKILKEPAFLGQLWQKLAEESSPEESYQKLQNLDAAWDFLDPAAQSKIIQNLIKTVWIGRTGIIIEFSADVLGETCDEVISVCGHFYNRTNKQQVFVHKDEPEEQKDPDLLKALIQAEIWKTKLCSGKYASFQELAEACEAREEYVQKCLYLTLLSPKIKEAIINGNLSPKWSLRNFNRNYPPSDWKEQEAMYLD
jgi:DNA invertase Pin-like site-specific DNA recombinase